MKVDVQLRKLIFFATLVIAGNVLEDNQTCYKVSKENYGRNFGSEANDFDIMKSNQDRLTLQHRVRGIKTCWDSRLTGIVVLLSNGDATKDIQLNTYGQLSGTCQQFKVAEDNYISTIQLSYDSVITGFSFITEKGDFRTYGYTGMDSLIAKFSFSESITWLGFYGTYTTVPTSLGALSFLANCDATFIPTLIDATFSSQKKTTAKPKAKPKPAATKPAAKPAAKSTSKPKPKPTTKPANQTAVKPSKNTNTTTNTTNPVKTTPVVIETPKPSNNTSTTTNTTNPVKTTPVVIETPKPNWTSTPTIAVPKVVQQEDKFPGWAIGVTVGILLFLVGGALTGIFLYMKAKKKQQPLVFNGLDEEQDSQIQAQRIQTPNRNSQNEFITERLKSFVDDIQRKSMEQQGLYETTKYEERIAELKNELEKQVKAVEKIEEKVSALEFKVENSKINEEKKQAEVKLAQAEQQLEEYKIKKQKAEVDLIEFVDNPNIIVSSSSNQNIQGSLPSPKKKKRSTIMQGMQREVDDAETNLDQSVDLELVQLLEEHRIYKLVKAAEEAKLFQCSSTSLEMVEHALREEEERIRVEASRLNKASVSALKLIEHEFSTLQVSEAGEQTIDEQEKNKIFQVLSNSSVDDYSTLQSNLNANSHRNILSRETAIKVNSKLKSEFWQQYKALKEKRKSLEEERIQISNSLRQRNIDVKTRQADEERINLLLSQAQQKKSKKVRLQNTSWAQQRSSNTSNHQVSIQSSREVQSSQIQIRDSSIKNIHFSRHLNDSLMFDFGESQLSQRNQTKDYNPGPLPNTKLIAGYLDPEWTKTILLRNQKGFQKRHLSQDQKNLLAKDRLMKANAKEGKQPVPFEKVLNLKMNYGMNKTLREVQTDGFDVVLKRSQSPQQSSLRNSKQSRSPRQRTRQVQLGQFSVRESSILDGGNSKIGISNMDYQTSTVTWFQNPNQNSQIKRSLRNEQNFISIMTDT